MRIHNINSLSTISTNQLLISWPLAKQETSKMPYAEKKVGEVTPKGKRAQEEMQFKYKKGQKLLKYAIKELT